MKIIHAVGKIWKSRGCGGRSVYTCMGIMLQLSKQSGHKVTAAIDMHCKKYVYFDTLLCENELLFVMHELNSC